MKLKWQKNVSIFQFRQNRKINYITNTIDNETLPLQYERCIFLRIHSLVRDINLETSNITMQCGSSLCNDRDITFYWNFNMTDAAFKLKLIAVPKKMDLKIFLHIIKINYENSSDRLSSKHTNG